MVNQKTTTSSIKPNSNAKPILIVIQQDQEVLADENINSEHCMQQTAQTKLKLFSVEIAVRLITPLTLNIFLQNFHYCRENLQNVPL